MKQVIWLAGLLVVVVVGSGAFIWSGAYNIAADEPHWSSTEQVMETVRDRSVEARLSGVVVPNLDDESLIRTGAGNYDAMCAGCHLEPGEDHTELSAGLYPGPPNLGRDRSDDPAEAFWVIKHGIKMSGMPAWGKSMDDDSIWGMVAFLQKLPGMSADQYHEQVEASEGHSHGAAEAAVDAHVTTHVHADGSEHEHKD
ncbi:MAG: cytochrome c [Gammaproteobacteria bacterium]|nr:cytochrome c [Gammaproteobacteria bacterium]